MRKSSALIGLALLGSALAACAPSAPKPTTLTQPPAGAPAATMAPARYTLNAALSEARYHAREQLFRLPLPREAIGTTKELKGAVVFGSDGKVDPAQSKVTVDIGSIKSQEPSRDKDINNRTLEVLKFPTAEFVVKDIKGLGAPMPTAGSRELELLGDLTIHGVSVPVTWNATAQFTDAEVKGLATTTVTFAPFGMTNPKSPSVHLSLDDNVTLELEFVFTKN